MHSCALGCHTLRSPSSWAHSWAIAGAAGCNDDPASARESGQAVAATDTLSEEEEALLKRRDALLNSRRSLREKRAALAEERRRLLASGGDTAEVDKKATELEQEEAQLGDAEVELDRDLEDLFAQQRAFLAELGSTEDSTSKMAAREAALASREKSLASRERRLADRESTLADRERKLAIRERDTCAAVPTTVIQTQPAKGTRFSRRDVDPLLKRARRSMSRRGVLRSDLPAAAQGLESEATKAMAGADYGRARFAATQLITSVEAIKVDKTFIQAKIARLNNRIKKLQLDKSTRQNVDDLFRKATANYGDGKFGKANKQLNRIYTLISSRG